LIFRADAKINLALHITGQREDGYHTLESLVTFARVADLISIEAATQDRLTFSGPFGASLAADFGTNLMLKALAALRAHVGARPCPPVAMHLEKNLPLASGIGGGSADAAATLRGLNHHWGIGLSDTNLADIGATLGADVPMCVHGAPLIAKGIGEVIEPVSLPVFSLVLVNPRVSVSTPQIFKALTSKNNAPLPALGKEADNLEAFLGWLSSTRNDLQAPAINLQPVVAEVVKALQQSGALFARMSGSGATCFGIFADNKAAEAAKVAIEKGHPRWWVA
jgi:4-diphosphocytidyl-2-C-methyl-D-erythritol kinase